MLSQLHTRTIQSRGQTEACAQAMAERKAGSSHVDFHVAIFGPARVAWFRQSLQ